LQRQLASDNVIHSSLAAPYLPTAVIVILCLHALQDRQGDAEAGVRTLPVVLGPHAALGTCAGLLAACAVLAAHSALLGTGLSWAWAANASLEAPLRAAMLAAVAGVMYGPAAAALRVLRSSFDRGEVASAVSKSMGSIAAGTLLLALLV
jgi:4-hydroxybenzoate polyprenyltransferase